jgi:metal-sulfur cluster biosynthetic enzyme
VSAEPSVSAKSQDQPCPFSYGGPEELRDKVVSALTAVVDPELALTIVDLGLVYGVEVDDDAIRVRMTMT